VSAPFSPLSALFPLRNLPLHDLLHSAPRSVYRILPRPPTASLILFSTEKLLGANEYDILETSMEQWCCYRQLVHNEYMLYRPTRGHSFLQIKLVACVSSFRYTEQIPMYSTKSCSTFDHHDHSGYEPLILSRFAYQRQPLIYQDCVTVCDVNPFPNSSVLDLVISSRRYDVDLYTLQRSRQYGLILSLSERRSINHYRLRVNVGAKAKTDRCDLEVSRE